MTTHLKKLSGSLFYLLATTFFLAYLLSFNELGGPWANWWMQVADLPLAVVALLYGSTSLYLSVTRPDAPSTAVLLLIAIPTTAFFALCLVMNFWDVLKADAADAKTFWLNWLVIELIVLVVCYGVWKYLPKSN